MKMTGKLILVFLLLAWPGSAQSGENEIGPQDVKALVDQRLEEAFNTTDEVSDQMTGESPQDAGDSAGNLEEPPPQPSEPLPGSDTPLPSGPPPPSGASLAPAPPTSYPAAPTGPGKPDWVSLYQQGEIGRIAPGHDSYFGVGSSPESQAGADTEARLEFARNVETRVESQYREAVRVADNKEEYSLEISTKVLTDLSLKGVRITRVWRDGQTGTFYSLIVMSRGEYAALLERNIQEELALQKTRLAKERADLEAQAERQQLAALEKQNQQDQEALRLAEQKRLLDLKEQKAATNRSRYRRFLETTPQAQLIGFRNGQLSPHFQRYRVVMGVSPGLSPFSGKDLLQQISLGYTFFQFAELSADSHFLGEGTTLEWTAQEFGLKIRVLDNAGDIIRVSLGGGGKIILLDPLSRLNDDPDGQQISTFFGSAVVSLPMVLSSHISLYAGADRVAAGIITHPLFFLLGDAFGLIGEVNYIIPDELRHPEYRDGWLVQGGLRFRAGKTQTTLAWRGHQTLTLGLELNF